MAPAADSMAPARCRERTKKAQAFLAKAYPDASCALRFSNPLELLVATILSAQCTDARVNEVTKALFATYRTARDYAQAKLEAFMQAIRPTGFYRNKAKNIVATAKAIEAEFGGEVPRTMDELVRLPGVARKTANVVLGTAFGIPDGIVVDTHVIRLSGRLGLSPAKDPVKIERDLMQFLPRTEWISFGHRLTTHGRVVCLARAPKCAVCGMNTFCLYPRSIP